MGKSALDAKRGDYFWLEPEHLTLVMDEAHPLYDARVHDAPDESLVRNIMVYGVKVPIIVRKNGGVIEVVDGRGRVKATLEANRRLVAEGKIPIQIKAITEGGPDDHLMGVMVLTNEQRREDTMINRGAKARRMKDFGKTDSEIAVTFGVSVQAVRNWIAADELPQEVKDAVESGEVSATAALQMSGHSREEQVRRVEDLRQQGIKPTVQNMKIAAASPENKAGPRIRARREIQAELEAFIHENDSYQQGYLAALSWVLRED